MRGLLVYNGSFINFQIEGMLKSFARAFKNLGAELQAAVSGEFTIVYDGDTSILFKGQNLGNNLANCHSNGKSSQAEPFYDFVLFWDKNIRLAAAFEALCIPVFNTSRAIAVCDDKVAVYEALSGRNIPMPLTVAAPFIYYNREPEDCRAFLEQTAALLGFPVVVKEACGSLGMQVYLVNDMEGLINMYDGLKHRPHLYQKFIAESKGLDIRVYVIGGKAAGACERFNAQDFRSNTAYGGRMSLIKADGEYIETAEAAARLLGLDYCAVDFLKGKDGPLLCEVNSNAFFNTYTGLGGTDIAVEYARHIINKICV